jgi:hypothetical protein
LKDSSPLRQQRFAHTALTFLSRKHVSTDAANERRVVFLLQTFDSQAAGGCFGLLVIGHRYWSS